ncbi:metal-sensitive transcriptional regulator [bacterium]|nr:metal-sensitive transcriptional regulator [bacterium]
MASYRKEGTNLKLSKRLKRIEGQIRGINKMIEENRNCMDIMHQVQSASSALRSVWEILAASHLEDCINNENNIEIKKNLIEEIISCIKELR